MRFSGVQGRKVDREALKVVNLESIENWVRFCMAKNMMNMPFRNEGSLLFFKDRIVCTRINEEFGGYPLELFSYSKHDPWEGTLEELITSDVTLRVSPSLMHRKVPEFSQYVTIKACEFFEQMGVHNEHVGEEYAKWLEEGDFHWHNELFDPEPWRI